MVLIVKSIMPVKAADAGIFNLQNQEYKGFQQGNPGTSRDSLVVDLYSDDDHFEMILQQKNYNNPAGVTQPEINRIVQSVHRLRPSEVAISTE